MHFQFHHHEKDDQKNASEHVLEVETLCVLVLYTLIFSFEPTTENLLQKIHMLSNEAKRDKMTKT
jgi:hypothetical protein